METFPFLSYTQTFSRISFKALPVHRFRRFTTSLLRWLGGNDCRQKKESDQSVMRVVGFDEKLTVKEYGIPEVGQ